MSREGGGGREPSLSTSRESWVGLDPVLAQPLGRHRGTGSFGAAPASSQRDPRSCDMKGNLVQGVLARFPSICKGPGQGRPGPEGAPTTASVLEGGRKGALLSPSRCMSAQQCSLCVRTQDKGAPGWQLSADPRAPALPGAATGQGHSAREPEGPSSPASGIAG